MAPRMVVTAPVEQKKADALLIRKLNLQRRKKLELRLGTTKIKDGDLLQIGNIDSGRLEKLVARIKAGQPKVDAFLSAMFHWYRFLDPHKRRRLTPRQLKRQALAICREYFIIYERLPIWWVDRMKAVVGLKLYRKKEEPKKEDQEEEARSSPPNRIPSQKISSVSTSWKIPASS